MVRDTVAHLRAEGQRVFLDAEHFFDGYRDNRDYALEVLRTAFEAGAEVAALCDTNGGMLPGWVGDVVNDVVETTGVRVGIHCHNDPEYDHLWRPDVEALSHVAEMFTSAPFVDVGVQRMAGHSVELHTLAHAFYMKILSFVEECIFYRLHRSSL